MSAQRTVIAWALAALTLLAACGDEPRPPRPEMLPGDSIYQLQGHWTDQSSERVALDLFARHPVAIVMFYGTCEYACPVLVHDVQRLETELPADLRERLRVLLVTLDPERDTPARLAEYAARNQLPRERWRLLRGDPQQVLELAAALEVRYRDVGGGNISHTMRISLLDGLGRIAHRVDGLEQPVEPLVQRVSTLLEEEEN